MFEIHSTDAIDRQAEADFQEYQRGMSYSRGQTQQFQEPEEVKAANALYDRLESQWTAFLEVGFTLSAITGAGALICLMRVFGAGGLALSIALMVVISIVLLLIFFWQNLSNSEYKLRFFLISVALIAGLIISMSDMAIDGTRHYWAILSGVSIVTGVSSVVVLGLILAVRHGND